MKTGASLVFLLLAALMRGQSALDGFDPNASSTVDILAVQPDGKILVGGFFTNIGGQPRNRIARLNPDGTLDTTFNPDASSLVFSIVLQGNGKILVGGFFNGANSIGGQMRNYIARLDSNGTVDSEFNPNANSSVYAIAEQTDGKILVGGIFTEIGGQTRNHIARLDAVTGLADSFNPNVNGEIYSIALQADGKILIGGSFTSVSGQVRNNIARLNPDGTPDSVFHPSANNRIQTIAVQADGKVLAGGRFTTIDGQTRNRIARLDAETGLADSLNPDADDDVLSIAVQPNGKILAGGFFSNIGGQPRNSVARLDAISGSADSFDPNLASGSVYALTVQADGKILMGGQFFGPLGGAGAFRNCIARLETDGRVDQTLNLSTIGTLIWATSVQPDGKILIAGIFTSVLGVERNNIARLNADGTLDTVFNPNASDNVASIALQADGKILVGGDFTSIGGQSRNRIARLDATTGMADSFNPNSDGFVETIVVQADGKILAGGTFVSIGGQTRNHIARLDATTGLADSLDPNANGNVRSIAVQADGKILAGGIFTSIGGQARNRLARLDPATGLADSFNPNANNSVQCIAVQVDGKILVGGAFNGVNSIGGQNRNHIARLDSATGFADLFNPIASLAVLSIELQADGKILVGGLFSGTNGIGGRPRDFIARLDPETGVADSFNPAANDVVYSLGLLADGKILAGGQFTSVGGEPRSLFARLTNDTPALQNLDVTQSTITWTRAGSSPHFTRVTFEFSNDNMNFTQLGNATAAGENWILTGLNLPTEVNVYIRAHGHYCSGQNDGSESVQESLRNVFLTLQSGTPTPTPPISTPTPTPTATPSPSITPPIPTPTPTPSVPPTTLGNISTRLRVETGENVLIGGFIVTGTQPKRVIVRAIGPSLPVAGELADPILELRDSSGVLIRSNDNWRSDQEAEIIGTGIAPSNDLESAIVAILPANNSAYTAIVRGVNDGTGVGLIEAYDLDRTVNSKLANISTRGLVQTEENVLIAGTIVLGQAPQRVLVRAIGPSLPVAGKLEDPVLELRDGNGTLIRSNDNWRSDQEAEIMATMISPSDDLESALIEILPGNGAAYTATVRGVNNTTGVAVVEVYVLN